MESETKKPRLDTSVAPSTSRRSQRQRRVRGEKEITVSSSQTLLELKREVISLKTKYYPSIISINVINHACILASLVQMDQLEFINF